MALSLDLSFGANKLSYIFSFCFGQTFYVKLHFSLISANAAIFSPTAQHVR